VPNLPAKILTFCILLLTLSSLGTSTVSGSGQALYKLHPLLIDRLNGKITGQLRMDGEGIYVFVALRPGTDPTTTDGFMISKYFLGPQNDPMLIYGEARLDSLVGLASNPGVAYIYPDLRVDLDRMKPDADVYREGLATDMFRVRQIIGADRVNELGIKGDGVTIAIVDTGTDFNVPDLQNAIARDSAGRAISFDADGQSFVITSLVVQRVGNVLNTAGKYVDVWNAQSYTQTTTAQSSVVKVKIGEDYGAPSVLSKSGNYHFGILRESIQDVVSGETVTVNFPVVVIDANQANVYDTVVVDTSTAYYSFLKQYGVKLNSEASQSLNVSLKWPAPNPAWNVHSFANDQLNTATPGNDLISFKTANGLPAFSAGLLSFGIDLGGLTGHPFALLPPIDTNGNFINVFFDFESHGTSTASNAASRGVMERDIYKNGTMYALPGIAPDAKIIGVKALWLGDITFGWYYAAGFDWDPANFAFKYTGQHRADIISNSWGDSDPIADLSSTFGADYMSQLADAFTLPRYLDPSYPGTIMVMAAGNGGFGYGTTTSPAAATLVITVGASTSYSYRANPAYRIPHEVEGTYDEVIPWSARGPTSLGEPKPDIVDIGAFGFTDQSIFTGYGNATKAYDIFGGTSMATPVTSGAIALVVQEYRQTHQGVTPSPDLVKAILSSTATDLSYDTYTQGSGRVDVFEAVAAAAEGRDSNFPTRYYAYSTTSWQTVQKLLANSWALNLQSSMPNTPMMSTNWYAGIITPGGSTTAEFTLSGALNPQAEAFHYNLIQTRYIQNVTSGNITWVTLPKDQFPSNADLMKVTLIYHFSDFVNATAWDYKDLLIASLYDTHIDSAGDLRRITNAAPTGTTSELVVGKPLEKFEGIPKVRIVLEHNLNGTGNIPFELIIRFYQRVQWSWISQLNISGDRIVATLTVPNGTEPGAYSGMILVSVNQTETLVPVSVLVPILTAGSYSGGLVQSPYEDYAVFGAFDWAWRYEAGDWRTFAIVVPTGVSKITVTLSWSDNATNIQEHLTGPFGYLVASSEFPTTQYEGNGKFAWSTSTGGPSTVISAENIAPGIYLLVLHNTLFGASNFSQYPENFTINIEYS